MGEDVLVQAGDELELCSGECEARLLQLDGDGHLTRASVHWEMGDLDRKTMSVLEAINKRTVYCINFKMISQLSEKREQF